MAKNKKPLIIVGALLGVLLIASGVFLYVQKQKPKEIAEIPKEKPRRETPTPLVTPPPAEEMTYETFKTKDGNFSFDYPAAWIQTEIKNLETVLPKAIIEKYELSMPLILSDPRGARIILAIYHFDKGMDLNAIMDSLKDTSASLGAPYNEISRSLVANSLVVDSKIEAAGAEVKVRDILYLSSSDPKNIVYNLSFTATGPSWSEYEPIFSYVQSSAKLSL